ncbi:hypothetical protein ACFQ7B_07620 [Streptomyces erythrochromogenes]|uniref:hypothetical protein n=1 Tax=Streptomyces erythrochromogenes TaxID=285574 RepID=UPI0036CF1DBB
MASALYPSFKQLLLGGDIDLAADDIRAVLVDTADYTYSAAHDFLDDVAAGARVAVSGALASKTIASGVFDAADVTFTAATGDSVEAVVLYKHTGSDATASLIAYIDGVSVTPNGGNIVAQWNASGIFAL